MFLDVTLGCRTPYQNAMTDAIGAGGGADEWPVVVEDGVITQYGFTEHTWIAESMGTFLTSEGRFEGYEDCLVGPFPESCATIQLENLDAWAAWYETNTAPTSTTIPVVEASSSPGLSRFNSTSHGISIDFPSGWQVRSATEPWTSGELNFDSPEADVIFDPDFGNSLYIVIPSQPRDTPQSDQDEQFDLIRESAVCDPDGSFGGGSFTVDGASAWYQDCEPGMSGANDLTAVAVTTDNRRYLIVLVTLGEPGLDEVYDFDAALETVDLRPEETR